jgi:hypothetical protein
MARLFEVHSVERAYTREAVFGVELLDALTLERVSRGVEVTAVGLTGQPRRNSVGVFVWLKEDLARLTKLVVTPSGVPFERVEIPAAQIRLPLHQVLLNPLASYPFAPGNTAVRGRLVERNDQPPAATRIPIPRATVTLEWADNQNRWRPWIAPAVTSVAGDFVAAVRFAPLALPTSPPTNPPLKPDDPKLDADGNLSVRLTAKRTNGMQKSRTFLLRQGRVADETYAWNDLQ